MKQLKDYILEQKLDIFDKQLHSHFYISQLFDIRNIYEGHLLFEGSGIFKGCSDIVDKVVTSIFENNDYVSTNKSKYEYSYNDFEGIEHFFDKLTIVLHSGRGTNGDAEYDYKDDDWNGVILKKTKIHFYSIYTLNINDFAGLLTHELTHVYDNYIAHKFLDADISTKNDIKIEEILNTLNELHDKLQDDNNNDDLKRKISNNNFVKRAYYYLDKYEINAFISQLSMLIKRRSFKNSTDYLENVRKLSTYKKYKKLYEESLKPNNVFSKLNINNKDIKMFKKQANRAWKKLINHTYLAYIENVEKTIKEHKSFRSDWLYDFDETTPVWKRLRN